MVIHAISEAAPLGELLEHARQLADRFGVRNPAPTVLVTEPLSFWNEGNARQWLHLNHVAQVSLPFEVGPIVVMAVQIGVYQLVAHWPSSAAI